ncbi:ATP-binding cassette domain-containing protein [Compostimonas suwonensis]|uniref:ABC-type multidrug transport system ATPase subunit n=1 Tax=Compostimonas suwonensis TaxID=1048394 RepID=A0A2M9BW97_9MICO|nr:ABC transporter ATP-binding protein [Compostimonas suwonensis]PJJ62184.1 ABC-type multidrug transport system ATPase subunit [Compostimonas suwonensis]
MTGEAVLPIELDQVTKRYGDRTVLREVDLALAPGTSFVIEGANGSGKSTLLRLIAGVAQPTSGRLRGIPRRVGYLPERFTPPPLMRADAYLRHIGRISGLTTARARARTEELMELLVIRPTPRHRLGTLSKGNLQKVGIAQVFVADHELIVLDEPRTGLEISAWPTLSQLIRDRAAQGGLVVSTEHEPGVIDDAQNLLRVNEGRVATAEARQRTPRSRRFRILARPTGTDPAGRLPPLSEFRTAQVDAPTDARTSADLHSDEVRIRVEAAEKDALLLELLQSGWSVTDVRSEDGDA